MGDGRHGDSGSGTERLHGIGGSGGVGSGDIMVVGARRRLTLRAISAARVPVEIGRFEGAVLRARQQVEDLIELSRRSSSRVERSILEAYSMMLGDPLLQQRVADTIAEQHVSAEWALGGAIAEVAQRLRGSSDRYLRERSRDIESVGELLQDGLASADGSALNALEAHPHGGVLVAHQLAPTQIATLDARKVAALVTETGTATSHTAIVARALGVPAVVGCVGIVHACTHHRRAVVDGRRGTVTLSPTDEELAAVEARQHRRRTTLLGLREQRAQGIARTRCGTDVLLLANTEFPHEVDFALAEGAGGIGLYRTEFLCGQLGGYPSEADQYAAYCDVLRRAKGQPVTFRTFDIGDDKAFAPNTTDHPRNPALGRRGVRLGLAEPQILETQFRSLLRASAQGDLRVMLPMVTTVAEYAQARTAFGRIRNELQRAGVPMAGHVPLGCMIEVPAAALTADRFAAEAEFLSVGTNDLIQYACAVDRSDARLASLSHPLQPAVLELVERVVAGARGRARPVTVCGAMASDPHGALMLVALGIRALSVEASALPLVHELIRRVSIPELGACLREVRGQGSADGVTAVVERHFGALLAELPDV